MCACAFSRRAAGDKPTIIYTITDEAPALATYSFLPVVNAFGSSAGLNVETRDISLGARIHSAWNDVLPADQQVHDALAELGDLAKTPEANIIKLPNISASVPQMNAAIAELQAKGYALPDYPAEATTAAEQDAQARYDKVKGSAVNPVLREGNSDRRAPPAVKAYARQNPHRMGKWKSDSKAHVSTMGSGDFFSNEQSVTIGAATSASIEFTGADGSTTVLTSGIDLLEGEIIDSTFMSVKASRGAPPPIDTWSPVSFLGGWWPGGFLEPGAVCLFAPHPTPCLGRGSGQHRAPQRPEP